MADSKHSGYATATGAAAAVDFGAGYTSTGWVMVPTSVAPDSALALEVSPDNTTWTRVGQTTGARPVIWFGGHIAARYARINVVALGTNPPGAAVGAVLKPAA